MKINEILDRHIEKIHENDEDRSLKIHVTDLFRCQSGVFYEKTGVVGGEKTERLALIRRFEVGHRMEELVVDALRDTEGIKFLPENKEQIVFEDGLMVGTPDVVALVNGKPVLIEVKSTHPFAFDAMKGKPHAHYIEQTMLYLHKLREIYPEMTALLFYISLDGRVAQFDVPYSLEVVNKLLDRARTLKHALETGVPPEPAPDIVIEDGVRKKNWVASYCVKDGTHKFCLGEPELTEGKWEYRVKKLLGK
jgi:CRISPR/Cas system-associated exonuclease Cas4 (RecB family)